MEEEALSIPISNTEPKTIIITIRIDYKLRDDIKKYMMDQSLDQSKAIRELIQKGLK